MGIGRGFSVSNLSLFTPPIKNFAYATSIY